AGAWKTWVLESGSDLRVPPPPKAGSAAAKRDGERLKAAIAGRSAREESTARRYGRDLVVKPWLEQNMRLVSGQAKDVPASSRAYSNTSVAIYDAVVAAMHWKYVYRRRAPQGDSLVPRSPDPTYPSEHATIAGAASRVLAYLYPEYPQARLDRDAEDAAQSLVAAGAIYPSDAEAGLELGREVAKRVIANARRDGFETIKWDGKRPRGPEHWEPPPGSEGRPNQPLAGRWKTWTLRNVDRFRPQPPAKYGSKRFIANARDVMRAKERLTPRQRRIADFWEGMEGTALPAGIWNQVVLAYLDDEKPLSVSRQARTFALFNVALADAGGAVWSAKYRWWDPRPINSIRDLGLDRRWKPYLSPTPLFPAYPSGTSTYSGAAGETLGYLFPKDARYWRDRATDAGYSRLWGGAHWRPDVPAGLGIGRKVARVVVERAKQDGADKR
ncbi:MAG: phosphatase PAP2 family protein, partial [Actinomycetota bacterium]|nr:phosphatase PAP2 family protein [Actinomycetota bacterium]